MAPSDRKPRTLSWHVRVAALLPALSACADPPANADTDDTEGTTGDTEGIGINTMSTSSSSTTNNPSTTDPTDTGTDTGSTTVDTTGGSESTLGVSETQTTTSSSSSSSSSESSSSSSSESSADDTTTTSPDDTTTSGTSTAIGGGTGDPFETTTIDWTTGSTSSSEGGSESTGDPVADQDGDGFVNADDNCPAVENPDQSDVDGDGQGDWCDDEIIDDGDRLYVPRNTDYELFGEHCYTGEVRIYGTLLVTNYNAAAGAGTLTIAAAGRVWVPDNGRIRAVGAGYRGGNRSSLDDRGGFGGQGTNEGCGGGPGFSVGQAGSGGGYGGAGGPPSLANPYISDCDSCSEATIAHCVGPAGATSGTQDGEDVEFGSGGGAGGNSDGCTDTGGIGGFGGGIIVLVSEETVRVDGVVTADGRQPPRDTTPCASINYNPGGGGGSGGAVVLAAPTIEGDASGQLSAAGGRGGNSTGDGFDWAWAGGGGGGGRIKLFGDTTGFLGTTDVAGGTGGDALPAGFSYVGESGQDGTVGGSAIIPAIWVGFACP